MRFDTHLSIHAHNKYNLEAFKITRLLTNTYTHTHTYTHTYTYARDIHIYTHTHTFIKSTIQSYRYRYRPIVYHFSFFQLECELTLIDL